MCTRRVVRVIIVALVALAVPNVAWAQTVPGVFDVDTTKDGNDGECAKDCTLREAVIAATVVGTKWLVEDRCTSTLTKVARGKVRVRDFVKHKTVLVKKGRKYIARAK